MPESYLPDELLQTIGKKILAYDDYIRFRAVCTAWRKIPKFPTHIPYQLPWLLLPQSGYNNHRRTFVTPNKQLQLNLPEASYPNRHCGSSHGWLAIVTESSRIFIVNPLTKAKINLPPLSAFPNVVSFDCTNFGEEYVLRTLPNNHYTLSLSKMRDNFIKKIVLSNSPSCGADFIAVAIIRRLGEVEEGDFEEGLFELAFCKSGQTSWKLIDKAQSYYTDVIFFNGLIYGLSLSGMVVVCDVNGDSPEVVFIGANYLNMTDGGDNTYLVNAMGELLLVARYLNSEVVGEDPQRRCKTIEFKIFRYDFNKKDWEPLMNLGDNLLFLGGNSSMAVSTADYPELRGNRIYFSEGFSKEDSVVIHGDYDIGIFNLEDGTVEPLPNHPQDSRSPLSWPPPVWVTPNISS